MNTPDQKSTVKNLKMFVFSLLAITLAPPAPHARANDLLGCLKGSVDLVGDALGDAAKLADFLITNSQCVPYLVEAGGLPDPAFIAVTAGLFVAKSQLGFTDKNSCLNAGGNVLARELVKSGVGDLLGGSISSSLEDIANGASHSFINQIPGFGEYVDCGCAVVAENFSVFDLAKIYSQLSAAANSCLNFAEDVVNGVVTAVDDIGCTLGVGGCEGPPPSLDQFYAQYYAPHVQDLAPATDGVIQQVLAPLNNLCSVYWGFWADFGVINSAPAACAQLSDRFRSDIGFAKDALASQRIADARNLGIAITRIWFNLYSSECVDSRCHGEVFILSFAMVADFIEAAANSGYVDENDPRYIDAIHAAEYSIQAKFKPLFQHAISVAQARIKTETIAVTTSIQQKHSLIQGRLTLIHQRMAISKVTKAQLKPLLLTKHRTPSRFGARAYRSEGLMKLLKKKKPETRMRNVLPQEYNQITGYEISLVGGKAETTSTTWQHVTGGKLAQDLARPYIGKTRIPRTISTTATTPITVTTTQIQTQVGFAQWLKDCSMPSSPSCVRDLKITPILRGQTHSKQESITPIRYQGCRIVHLKLNNNDGAAMIECLQQANGGQEAQNHHVLETIYKARKVTSAHH